jgi:predicted acetyltransferase
MTELRALMPDDDLALLRLMSEAFTGGSRPTVSEPEESKDRVSTTLGVFDGVRLVAAATIHDLHLIWGQTDVPMGGIAGVACAAEQRGRGHVARLLAESLRTMREEGQVTSGLYPFAYAFYRRHGWEWVGEKRRYNVPTSEIRASPDGKYVRCYDGLEAREAVRPVYEAFARRHRGMATRADAKPDFWKRALDHHDNQTTYVQVYHDPETDQAEGYLTFRYPNGGETGHIGEFFANTPAAYRGLLSTLHYYGTQVQRVEFSAPTNDPLPLHVMHHDLHTAVGPIFMGRVVDVAPAFAALMPEPPLTGRLALQVSDGSCEWNHQTFAIAVEAGQVTAGATQEAPGVSLDIQALSQAYWGQPSLDLLRAAGRLTVADEAQYQLLVRLLPPSFCYLQDGF